MEEQSHHATSSRGATEQSAGAEREDPIPYVWYATSFLLLQQQTIELADEPPSAFTA